MYDAEIVLKRTALGWPATAMAVAVVASGCTTSSAPPDGSAAETTRTAQPTQTAEAAVDREAMQDDEQTAVKAVDGFWRRHFAQQFGQPYRSPRVAGAYTGTDGPSCGGEPSVPFNAFYCRPGDFLAWDEDLMAAGYSQIGDAWVYLIIAHEWGHAIQARLDNDLVSVAAELQADCLAGAALQGAADEGVIAIEPGDGEELAKTLAAVADDYPWTKESDHGSAEERTSSFNTGVQGGVSACI
ncbi:neutral zinc metallopeptidase [Kribbella sp. VKM Ac-2568]|uniref:neutral zinc metallopeptidase n=1 Tax=Kribbella sp. VKM Ac-2568 TaxID=2512219 RepID=UPI0018EE88E6|nr:neutral zinc metallopeptidase [Kribbella sp. VKM Ac-2568]